MLHNVFAVIITFNPTLETFRKNISSIVNQVEEVIVVDNGSNNVGEITNQILEFKNVTLLTLESNVGIGAATNIGIERLGLPGSWVLILDQDSIFPENGVAIYKEYLKLLENYNIGMLVPEYIERNNTLNVKKEQLDWKFVDYPIASGSFVNYSAWKTINGYDETLFIDRVDDDFDLRMRQNSYLLVQVNKVQLDHSIGNIKTKELFGKKINIYNHNAIRKYYQARNNIIFSKKHGNMINAWYRNTNLIIKTLLFENGKLDKLKNICKGIRDGIKYK